jgi:hypothetical protein
MFAAISSTSLTILQYWPAETQVHVGTNTRGMAILPTDTYAHLVSQLSLKFPELHRKSQGQFNVCFRDEDGDMLSMQDEGDFEAAVDVAR